MYRYLDARGMQKRLAYDHDLAEAIRSGEVKPGTMLGEGESGPWVPAARHPAYQRLAKSVGVSPAKAMSSAYRWRKPAIIGASIVALLVVGFMQVRGRQQRAELYTAYQGALLGVQAGRMPPAELLTDTPPDDAELEIPWIDLRAAADVLAGADSAMTAHGITTFDPPSSWLTAEYLRSARMHADVGRHWERYLAFHASFGARIPQLTRDGLHRYAQQAGPSRYRASILALDVEEKMNERMKPWYVRAQIANAAHALHLALSEHRGRVVMARNGAPEFEQWATTSLYNAHIRNLRDRTRELDVFEQPLRPDQIAILDAPAATVRSPTAPNAAFERGARTAAEMREEVRRDLPDATGRRRADGYDERVRARQEGMAPRSP